MKAPKYITSHRNFNEDDYAYLSAKGWTNREIAARWDTESGPTGWGGYWAKSKLASVTAR